MSAGTDPHPPRSARARPAEGEAPGEASAPAANRWGWLGRPESASPTRLFTTALAFAVVAIVSLVVSALADEPPSPVALVALMMVVFGIGELSARPAHLVIARLLGLATFVAFWIVVGVTSAVF